jgi:hypothetical protein
MQRGGRDGDRRVVSLVPEIFNVSDEPWRWLLVGPLGAALACFGLFAAIAIIGRHGVFGIALCQGPGLTLDEREQLDYPKFIHLFVFKVMLSLAWDWLVVAASIGLLLMAAGSMIRRARTGQWT